MYYLKRRKKDDKQKIAIDGATGKEAIQWDC